MLLMPGLVNTHCHAADSLFRGLIEDLPLEPWLKLVWKAEGAILTPETVRLGATLGLAELLLAGVTTTMDFFWFPEEGVAAARALGVRVATGGMFFDGPAVDGIAPGDRLAAAAAFFDAFGGADDVLPGCFPHGTYTVGPESLVAAKRLAEERGGLFSVHAAETRAERDTVTARYGRSVIRHLDALGVLDARTVLAHCVWLDDEEIAILARTGASVAHNPMSNLKLASGIAPVADMLRAGVRVTLGTDGAISGNDLDPWMALRLAATLHRAATLDATAVTTGQALRMATIAGAAALGAADRIGSLETGQARRHGAGRPRAGACGAAVRPTHASRVFLREGGRARCLRGGRQVVRAGALTRVDLGRTRWRRWRRSPPRIAASSPRLNSGRRRRLQPIARAGGNRSMSAAFAIKVGVDGCAARKFGSYAWRDRGDWCPRSTQSPAHMLTGKADAQDSTTARTVVYARGFLGFLNRPPRIWAPLWREASLNARLVTCLFVATLSGVGASVFAVVSGAGLLVALAAYSGTSSASLLGLAFATALRQHKPRPALLPAPAHGSVA